jgi:hypothetical protein
MRRLSFAVAAAALLVAATIRAQDTSRAQAAAAPARLSETGLFSAGTTLVDGRNRPYSPQYPLWSDGAGKSRWVYLPPGATIDARNIDAWEFPVGTRFWKEFAFAGRKVETRMLWKSAPEAWTFATYVWNDAQTDATLAPEDGVRDAAEVVPGKRHSIPAVADCHACHESTRIEILGFTALQLSPDRDPGALHGEPLSPRDVTLRTLLDEGLLHGAPSDLAANPPRIQADSPTTRAVLGYVSTNCGACHTANGPLASLGLDFRQRTRGPRWRDADLARLLHRETKWQRPGADDEGTHAIEPGEPEISAMLLRMRSRRPSSQMPPLGTVVADSDAVRLMTQWIGKMARPDAAATSRRAGGDTQ